MQAKQGLLGMDTSSEEAMTERKEPRVRSTGNISDDDDGNPRNGAIFDNTRTGQVLDNYCGSRNGISRSKPPTFVEYRTWGPGTARRRY
jgi:hypothetical protein